MDLETFQPLFDWLSSHPGWAGFFVFLIALAESLVVVGLIVPGTILMFGVGTLLGTGVLAFWETLALAFFGAVCGDGISFWLGYRYRAQIGNWWPFRKHPEMLARGQVFFEKHGGKSILFGRFVGPVRPVIPAVAGMMQMPGRWFLVVNVLSALLWAPAYLLPGMAFGASLELASEVATRLAILLLLLAFIVFLSVWLIRHLVRWLTPWAVDLADRLLVWGWGHPRLGRMTAFLVDPDQPEARGLALWGLLLLAMALFFLLLLKLSAATAPLPLDLTAYNFLHDLHTPWATQWMSSLFVLAGPLPLTAFTSIILLLLLAQGLRQAAVHVLTAVLFSGLMIWILQVAALSRPPPDYSDILVGSFPAWHSLGPISIFGFLAVLISGALPAAWRWLPYTLAGVLVVVASVPALYLGINWLSDVLAGLVLGVAWVAVLGLAYRRHSDAKLKTRFLLPGVVTAYVLVGLFSFAGQDRLIQELSREPIPRQWSAEAWWNNQWRELDSHRWDLRGRRKQPMNLQWRGHLPQIRETLLAQGWHQPPELTWGNALLWFSPQPELPRLPLLPNVHNGRHEALVMVKPMAEHNQQWLIRLWPVDVVADGAPVWQGSISVQLLQRRFRYFWLPQTGNDFSTPVNVLSNDLVTWRHRIVQRSVDRQSTTILITEKETM